MSDVYERALAKAELLTAYVSRPSIGEAITLLRALLEDRRMCGLSFTGNDLLESRKAIDAALAAFIGDTHA